MSTGLYLFIPAQLLHTGVFSAIPRFPEPSVLATPERKEKKMYLSRPRPLGVRLGAAGSNFATRTGESAC